VDAVWRLDLRSVSTEGYRPFAVTSTLKRRGERRYEVTTSDDTIIFAAELSRAKKYVLRLLEIAMAKYQ